MHDDDVLQSKTLGLLLRKIHIGIRRRLDCSAGRHQLDNSTGTHGYIIKYLMTRDGEDVFQRDIEKRFSMRRSTASSILSLMERNGMIVRVSVPHDARLKKLVLTDKARQYVSTFEEERNALEQTLGQGFSEEELKTLNGLLCRVAENLDRENDC